MKNNIESKATIPVRKNHIDGTNGRTFCGIKKVEQTLIVPKEMENFHSNCENCLWRLTEDRKYMLGCLKILRNIL